jgi:hypothetical protein
MKERVEDLGRLREKLDHLIDSEIFESINMHDEAFIEKFKDEDQLDTLRLQLKFVEEQLHDCYVIARGDEEE